MAEGASPALRMIQPYVLVSKQFAKRDPVVSYYGEFTWGQRNAKVIMLQQVCICLPAATMFAVQQGIPASRSDPSAKAFLAQLMDQLEVVSLLQELLNSHVSRSSFP